MRRQGSVLLAASLGLASLAGPTPAQHPSTSQQVTSQPIPAIEATSFRAGGQPGDFLQEWTTVTTEDGTGVDLWSGTLLVPENRLEPKSPPISIPFYRLQAATPTPGPPIFLLAGGPGSSWIDRFENPENSAEIEFYRSLGDVVLFDQRGAGQSIPRLSCDQSEHWPNDQAVDPQEVSVLLRKMAAACRQQWLDRGVELAAYNTRENAADVLALQDALGYEKMILVGGSYGSHLAFSLMREAPERIERALLYGIEGPDHTWDDPDAKLATLERIAGEIEASGAFAESLPEAGLIETLRAVIADLEATPIQVVVPTDNEGETETVLIDAHLVRRVSDLQAGRRSRPRVWPQLILDLHRRHYDFVARGALALRSLRMNHAMHFMMDCASGVSTQRKKRYLESKATAILGPINSEYQDLCPVWQARDQGDHNRRLVASDIPTLLVHGTWDTSTPIENARQAVAELSNGHLIEVVRGNHGAIYNLYKFWPRAHAVIGAFLRGEPVRLPSSVTLPPLDFTESP